MIFTAKQRSFYLNKQPFFLYRRDPHFRLKRELWAIPENFMAGATTVSTYILCLGMNMRRVLISQETNPNDLLALSNRHRRRVYI